MRKTKNNVLFLIFISMTVNGIFAQANKQTIEQLTTFRADYIKGILEKRPELMTNYYGEDVRLMPEFQKTIMGKKNALSYHRAFLDRFDIQSYKREKREILDLGGQVMEVGSFTMKMTLKNTGEDYELIGKYMDLWEIQEQGKLSLITQAWNYNHYPDFARHLVFAVVPVVNIAFQAHAPINSNISLELTALNRLEEITIIQHDAKVWAQYYADDGMFIYSFNPFYEGRKALDEFLEKHVSEMPVFEKLDIRNDRIDDLGTYIIEYASHVANWRNGADSGVNTGKDLRIWRREGDCSLKLFRNIAMYDY